MPTVRLVPELPWLRVMAFALLLLAIGLGTWEAYWRSVGFRPAYRNSDGLWAMTRRQVERAGNTGTIILGSSRALFDVDLEAWADLTGHRPIQLALEGSNPRPLLTHLADESEFRGLVVLGVTPGLFYMPAFGYREGAFRRYRDESPSQWLGQRLSMLIEPYVAFYDFDTELFRVLHRQTWWPDRQGFVPPPREVRKLAQTRRTRQSDLWTRLDDDPEYAALARDIWRDYLEGPLDPPPKEEAERRRREIIESVARDVEIIRARGGEVVFVRFPSTGEFLDAENKGFPRTTHWEPLLETSGSVGIHFADHPILQDVRIPEWSHISAADTGRFTRNLLTILRRDLEARGIERSEIALDQSAGAR